MNQSQKEVEDLQTTVEALIEENKKLTDRIERLEEDNTLLRSRINNVTRSLDNVEEDIQKIYDRSSLAPGVEAKLSPLEIAIIQGIDTSDYTPRVNHKRAARIVSNWYNWSTPAKANNKRVLNASRENLSELYKSKYGEELTSKDIARAFKAAEELSNGKVQHTKRDRKHQLESTENLATSIEKFDEFYTED